MDIFESPNRSGLWKCPICGTNDDKPVVLVKIDGTLKGRIMKAVQIHVDCIDLTLFQSGEVRFISQDLRKDTLA